MQNSVVAVYGGGRSTASGVVWRTGVVVTTDHSLHSRDTAKVIHAGDPVDAQIAGRDAGTDLAVLRVPSEGLVPIEKSDAAEARAGQIVLSVGRSRLGDLSASCGIVARTGDSWRTWRGGQMDRLIRPDVRLYVGMPGSALVAEGGRVLGINTPALARQAVITIPARTVDRVVDAILERGHVPRPFLGIAMQEVPIPEQARGQFPSGTEQALLIMHVEPNGPAAEAGAMVGDLILSFNGEPIARLHDMMSRLPGSRIGDTITLSVLRAGARADLAVKVGDRGQ